LTEMRKRATAVLERRKFAQDDYGMKWTNTWRQTLKPVLFDQLERGQKFDMGNSQVSSSVRQHRLLSASISMTTTNEFG
jgi:hypothetical protein